VFFEVILLDRCSDCLDEYYSSCKAKPSATIRENERRHPRPTRRKFLICCENAKIKEWYIAEADDLEEAVSIAMLREENPLYAAPLEIVSDVNQEKNLLNRIIGMF
jgi:hypothetical protein